MALKSHTGIIEPMSLGNVSFIPFKEIDSSNEETIFINVYDPAKNVRVSYPLHIVMKNENFVETGVLKLTEKEFKNPTYVDDDK